MLTIANVAVLCGGKYIAAITRNRGRAASIHCKLATTNATTKALRAHVLRIRRKRNKQNTCFHRPMTNTFHWPCSRSARPRENAMRPITKHKHNAQTTRLIKFHDFPPITSGNSSEARFKFWNTISKCKCKRITVLHPRIHISYFTALYLGGSDGRRVRPLSTHLCSLIRVACPGRAPACPPSSIEFETRRSLKTSRRGKV